MELKWKYNAPGIDEPCRSNCTFMELKCMILISGVKLIKF